MISGSQSGRSTKVPVVPFLEQHSTKIQILLQHMKRIEASHHCHSAAAAILVDFGLF